MEIPAISEPIEITEQKPYRRRIWVTVLLSIFRPELAFIYNGQLRTGIILAVIFAISDFIFKPIWLISFSWMILTFIIFIAIIAVLLIYNIKQSCKANRLSMPRQPRLWGWVASVLIGGIILETGCLIFIKKNIVEDYKMPSGSMENTLLKGDYLIAQKHIDPATLHRGEIIIFKFPGDTKQNYIKRIVALDGDRIKIINKQVFVNDQLETLPEGVQYIDSNRVEAYTDKGLWKKSPQGLKYWEARGNRDNMPEMTIPKEYMFVMGDNRDNSLDSRYWGFLDQKLVLGQAKYICFSWDSEKHWFRWNRIGKSLI
jgi:signal peptidase I